MQRGAALRLHDCICYRLLPAVIEMRRCPSRRRSFGTNIRPRAVRARLAAVAVAVLLLQFFLHICVFVCCISAVSDSVTALIHVLVLVGLLKLYVLFCRFGILKLCSESRLLGRTSAPCRATAIASGAKMVLAVGEPQGRRSARMRSSIPRAQRRRLC